MILRGQVFSELLEMETPISVLAPTESKKDTPRKVVYLLHGLCGCNDDFITHTMLPVYAAQYHCIFVMPSVARSFYADMVYGQRYFSYVAQELPQICRQLFHISSRREDTFIMGNSMGGYGALKCALTYPQQYAACCANAPGMLLLKDFFAELRQNAHTPQMQKEWGARFINDLQSAFGQDFAWSPDIEIFELAKRLRNTNESPRLLVQIGIEDHLLDINRRFNTQMQTLSLPFAYEESEGGHDFYFFDKAQKSGLEFMLGRI